MLIIRTLSADSVAYYFDGREQLRAGRWEGRGCSALGLDGSVDRSQLRRVMEGRDPLSGAFLAARRPSRRRAGWDLMFSAPKSVSLFAALHRQPALILQAHETAVDEVMVHLERKLLSDRPGYRRGEAAGVRACFEHHTNAAGEPHVHTHVLQANLAMWPDGSWRSVGGGEWKVARSELFGLYQLALRHHLTRNGFDLDWRIRPDGLADIADVPRAAVRATSTQSRAAAGGGLFAARRSPGPAPWAERSGAAGFGPAEAAGHGARETRPGPSEPSTAAFPAGLDNRVEARLAATRSHFRRADVVSALAATHTGGAPPEYAAAWAEGFCSASEAVSSPWTTPRWTTATARRADARLVSAALKDPMTGDHPLGRPNGGGGPEVSLESTVTTLAGSLARPGRAIQILGSSPGRRVFVEQAAIIDGARSLWQADGWHVAIDVRRPHDSDRWKALTGLERADRGRTPDIVVVDQADRRSTPHLLSLLESAGGHTRFVMVEGGSMPALTEQVSAGFTEVGERLGRLATPALFSVRAPFSARDGIADLGGLGQPSGQQALWSLTRAWAEQSGRGEPAILVGLGPEETEALNRAARAAWGAMGHLHGPGLEAAGRTFQSGERIVVLGSAGMTKPRGWSGTVVDVDARSMTVDWDDHSTSTLGVAQARRLGYGYALTPSLAGRSGRAVFLLGPAEAVPHLRARVRHSAAAPPGCSPEMSMERGRREVHRRPEPSIGLGL